MRVQGGPVPHQPPEGDKPLLTVRGLTKLFGSFKACDGIDLDIGHGEIHALLGENGAGKSTLVKMLFGILAPSAGTIGWEGQNRVIPNPAAARRLGIGMVFQHFSLFEALTVAENIALSLDEKISISDLSRKAAELSVAYGLPLDPGAHVADLSVGERQRIEIVRALLQNPKLIILDEPTASLNETDSDALLTLLMEFRKQGMTSIIITHKLNEIRKVADQITILRDGGTVETLDCHTQEITEDRIIKGMVGRDMEDRYPKREPKIGNGLPEGKNWNVLHQNH
eukprot:gene33929-38348_t